MKTDLLNSASPAAVGTPAKTGAFMARTHRGASSTSQELSLFKAQTLSADGANRWDRQILANRARDIVRNEPAAATAIRESTGMVIGAGWKLQSRPDADALGISPEDARKLGKQIESIFGRWACSNDPRLFCDAGRRNDFGGILRLAFAEYDTQNETFLVMRLRDDPGSHFQTCVQIVDSDRVSNPNSSVDTAFLRDGITLDHLGATRGFHLRRTHPTDYYLSGDSLHWDFVPRESDYGRPIGIHAVRQQRPGQTRGITNFAPLIEQIAMASKMQRAELQTSLINAMFGAFIKSGFDPQAVTDVLGLNGQHGDSVRSIQDFRSTFYDANPVEFAGTRLPVLSPGDEVSLNIAPRQASSFETFMRLLEQQMAAQLGVGHPQISGDFRKLNYSTLRGLFNSVWSAVVVKRADFCSQVVQPIFMCVVEEAIELGDIDVPAGAPDLYENPSAWLRSTWVGPARGQIDKEKESKADLIDVTGGFKSRTKVLAARGDDIEDLIFELAEEKRLAAEHGIDFTHDSAALSPSNPTIESQT